MADDNQATSVDTAHRVSVGIDGIYQGIINTLALPGYLVDAANHAPTVLNILPGEQGFSTFSDDPFLGSGQIRSGLTSLYQGYNDVAGVTVPQRVDTLDGLIGMGGEVAGGALVAGGLSLAAGSSPVLANGIRTVASGTTVVQQSPATGYVLGGLKGAARSAWWAATHPVTAFNALTGLAITGSAVDMTLNDGNLTGAAVGAVTNKAVESVTGYESLSAVWRENAPQEMQDMLVSFMEFMGENPMLAKWGSFGFALVTGNALIEKMTGNMPFGGLASLALAGAMAWGISEMFTNKALAFAQQEPRPETPRALQGIAAPAM